MRTYKEEVRKTVDEIFCDCCGKSCTISEPVVEHEYASIEAIWGYFSNQDGKQYNIEICEDCFNDVLEFITNKHKRILGPCKYPYEHDPLEGKSYFV